MTDRELIADVALNARAGVSGWGRVKCPLCLGRTGKPDRRGSLSILLAEGAYHCFKCGASGRYRDRDDGDYVQAPAVRTAVQAMRPPESFSPIYDWPARDAQSLEPARRYLLKRGITVEKQREARIGVCTDGRFANRVVVPLLAEDGSWLGYVGRVWAKRAPMPYLYPPGMARGELLYNVKALLVETDVPVMPVEGVFDTLALWPDSVALLGKPSEPQVEALVAAKRPVAVVMDGDAWEEGEMLALRLRFEGQRAGSVRLPPKLDPDEVPIDWLREEARRCIA